MKWFLPSLFTRKRPSKGSLGRIRGLTYIETLTVAAVVLILASAAIPMSRWGARRAKEARLQRNLTTIRAAINRYHKDAINGFIDRSRLDISVTRSGPPPAQYYPPNLATLSEGIPVAATGDVPGQEEQQQIYLQRIPRDPFIDENEECDESGWKLVAYQDDPDSLTWGGENVWDVRSCSELPALDGETYYNEW